MKYMSHFSRIIYVRYCTAVVDASLYSFCSFKYLKVELNLLLIFIYIYKRMMQMHHYRFVCNLEPSCVWNVSRKILELEPFASFHPCNRLTVNWLEFECSMIHSLGS